MRTIKFQITRILVVLSIIICGKSYAQSCTISSLAPYNVHFTDAVGIQEITINYVSGQNQCNSAMIFSNVPSWVTVQQDFLTKIEVVVLLNTGNSRGALIDYSYNGNIGSFYVSQDATCLKNWYLDTDNDSFGDPNGNPVLSCTQPTAVGGINYIDNDNDMCPNINGPDQGCPIGEVPENLNWIQSTVYDINGTVKAKTKAYFDDLGKGTQTQSLDTKTNKTWMNQTMYDAQGRPALSTLSAPINSTGTFLYKSDFVKTNGGATYTESNFESDPNNPSQVGSTANTLGAYYSTNNTAEPYQDVTSHPFSRIIYSELNPGAALKGLGGNKMNGEWKNGYTFSMTASEELSQSGAFNDSAYDAIKTIKTISRDVHGVEVVLFTDTDGKTLAAARTGGTSSRNYSVDISTQGFVDVHVPVGTTGFTIGGVSGITTEVYDLITEQVTITATSSLTNGFYRVSITNLDNYAPVGASTTVSITCKENYYDYSLNTYDNVGRLISSKQPLNHLETTFTYNTLGQLVSTTSPDQGTTNFKYKKDGQIRFSQNSKQLGDTEFSYTSYDNLGRPVESGVAHEDNEGIIALNNSSLLENTAVNSTLDVNDILRASGSEQQFTTYDSLETSDITYLTGVDNDYSNPSFLAGNVAKTKNDETTSYYSYDIYGRVQWIVQKINGLTNAKTIDYTYDPVTSAVIKVIYQKNTPSEYFEHKYTYDAVDNSLVKVETSTNGSNYTTHADYEYYETGALKRLEIATKNGTPLQGVDYVYNLVGQLKSINHPSLTAANDPGGDANDLFGMQIDYHKDDYSRPLSNIETTTFGQDQYNGNIKGIRWNNDYQPLTGGKENVYDYRYDKNNWLSEANYGEYATPTPTSAQANETSTTITTTGNTLNIEATESITLQPGFHAQSGSTFTTTLIDVDGFLTKNGDYDVSNISYDANGNIKTLKRNKNTVSGSNAMDNFTYSYKANSNQLDHVDDAVTAATNADDLKDQGTGNYKYNSIGQLTENVEEGIKYVYNASGLVTEILKDNVTLVKFLYNDKGHRVKKEIYTSGSITDTDIYVRDAAGTPLAIYRNNSLTEHTIYGASRLGVYKKADGSSLYQLTDHLGNVRAVTGRTSAGVDLSLTMTTDYYPFGMPMPNGRMEDGGDYRYAYQGQEKDEETGKEAFQLRLWDARIGRWLTTDPAGQYNSPYLGMGNNPVSRIDPDGGEDNPVYDSHGNYIGDTIEGFTGEAIIYDGPIKDFSQMTAKQLVNSGGGTYLSNYGFTDLFARDKIETHIVNHDWTGQVQIKSRIMTGLYRADQSSIDDPLVFRGVNTSGCSIADNYFEPTVENLQNLIRYHEVSGHISNQISGNIKTSAHDKTLHWMAMKKSIDHHSFNNTTDEYKGYSLYLYWYYRGDVSQGIYKSLFNEYGIPFKESYNK